MNSVKRDLADYFVVLGSLSHRQNTTVNVASGFVTFAYSVGFVDF